MIGKFLKVLHEIGAIGTMGSFAACIVLLATAPSDSAVAYAAVLQGIAAISKWLLVPSLALVLISGLLAIAANELYKNAAWAWIKALLGLSAFEGSLLTIAASTRHAAELSAAAALGHGDAAELAQVLHTLWGRTLDTREPRASQRYPCGLAAALLSKVGALNSCAWRYPRRRLGPMAQDFQPILPASDPMTEVIATRMTVLERQGDVTARDVSSQIVSNSQAGARNKEQRRMPRAL